MLALLASIAAILSFFLSYKNMGFLPWFIDFVHLFIVYFPPLFAGLIVYEIAIKKKYDVSKLLALNILFVVMVLGITFNKICPLTTLYNKAANLHPCTPFIHDIRDRLVDNNHDKIQYYTSDNDKCEKNLQAWLHGQLYTVLTIIFLDIIFFVKVMRQKSL